MDTKYCENCNTFKSHSDFYKGRKKCKICYTNQVKQTKLNNKILKTNDITTVQDLSNIIHDQQSIILNLKEEVNRLKVSVHHCMALLTELNIDVKTMNNFNKASTNKKK